MSYRCRGRSFECPKNSRTPRLAFAAALLCATGPFAQASTWTVNRTSDASVGIASNCTSTPQTNNCRLRDAFAASASGDTILFSVATNSVITLLNGPLTLANNLTVDASGSPGLRIDLNSNTRAFIVNSGVTGSISNLIISHAVWPLGDGGGIRNSGSLTLTNVKVDQCIAGTNSTAGNGGGIYNDGQLTLVGSTVSNSTAHGNGGGIYNANVLILESGTNVSTNNATGDGGGIDSSGTLQVTDSTVSGNTAVHGGGILGRPGGTVTLTNSTLSANSASAFGGGVINDAINGGAQGTLTLVNTTLFGNSATITAAGLDNYGVLTLTYATLAGNAGTLLRVSHGTISATNSLVAGACSIAPGALILNSGNFGACPGFTSANPLLGPLQDNGGPTLTSLPGPGSPAIDAVGCAAAPTTDQRGISRPQGSQCDAGAAEVVTCYVKSDAAGTNSGTSWADAYTDLQAALADNHCDQDWVARGVYKPTITSDRSISFNIRPRISVLGGFAGSETKASQRVAIVNPTVLSGDIDNNDTGFNGVDSQTTQIAGNNSFHVVVLDGTTAAGPILNSTLLDGFTITGGAANGAASDASGGGVFCNGAGAGHACSPTLSHILFAGNLATSLGGGIYSDGTGGEASPLVVASTFTGNHSANGGGAFADAAANAPFYVNDTFTGNSAAYGAALYTRFTGAAGTLTVSNITSSGNASSSGGAIAQYCVVGGSPNVALTNVLLWGDSGGPSGSEELVVANCASSPTFTNSIVMGSGGSGAWNPAFGTNGGGNLDVNPTLGPLLDNGGGTPTMLPSAGSPAIDAALDTTCNAAPVNALDQRGITRPLGVHCDIGAVEASPLSLSLTDHTLYLVGGQDTYYVLVLTNPSVVNTVSGIHVTGAASAALDGANTFWSCTPPDANSACSSGSGAFDDLATLGPSTSLVWVIGVTVVANSNEPVATFRVEVSGVGAASDSDILTIFHSGFESP